MSETEDRGAGDLLEPLSAYNSHFKEAFRRNCEAYFDGLAQESGVDAEQNRRTVAQYNAEQKKIVELNARLEKYRMLKTLLILLIVVGAALFLSLAALPAGGNPVIIAILSPIGAALIVTGAVVLAQKLSPVLKRAERKKGEHAAKAQELLREAWKQMEPLNELFEGNVTKKLIRETVPLLRLDDYFDMRRYDYLNGKYGYGKYDDPSRSVIGILTGEILGNPFVEERELVHTMGVFTYTGSLVISWTTSYVDSEGHLHTQHHTQTLTASVTKPKPYYSRTTRLIYGNDAAPDLHFSRYPAHAEDLTEKERERKVKKGVKKIRKKQKEAMERGGAFTELGNEEFDVLFGALDRDNEVQFRLLFTPLAQKNLLALIKDEKGYGDDFSMRKDGCLNYVSSEHSAQWDMEERRDRFPSYSIDLARQGFLSFNEDYFRSLYFDLAPLLSIPLYRQHKPAEYLYRDDYPRRFTRMETEYAVNHMDRSCFAPLSAATESILKTSFLSRDGESDCVRITANAYEAHERVDFVPVFGGDGRTHEVPVPWTEYLPVSETRTVKLKEIGLSDREFARRGLAGALGQYGGYGYGHGILCCVVGEDDDSFDETVGKELK